MGCFGVVGGMVNCFDDRSRANLPGQYRRQNNAVDLFRTAKLVNSTNL
jgi:hypothetical protein